MLQRGPDGGLFFGRALWDDGVRVLRVVVAFSDGQTAFALDLGDVEAGDFEAVPGFYEGLQLLIGGRGLRCRQREVRISQFHLDLIVRPVLAQKMTRETVCCLYHQKKDFISVPYKPKGAEYLK